MAMFISIYCKWEGKGETDQWELLWLKDQRDPKQIYHQCFGCLDQLHAGATLEGRNEQNILLLSPNQPGKNFLRTTSTEIG